MKDIATLVACLSLFWFVCVTSAQDLYVLAQDWDKHVMPKASAADKNLGEVVLKERYVVEYDYEEGRFFQYVLHHKVIYVNSDKAIEANNKIYLPAGDVVDMLIQKARVVTKDNKVVELDEQHIKETVDEETKTTYRYFACQGLEAGGQIEFLFVMKKFPSYNGASRILQCDALQRNVEFELVAPRHLLYAFKSYNGFPAVQRDTLWEGRSRWFARLDSVPALKPEDQSAYRDQLMRVVYKLHANVEIGKYNISSYASASQFVYNNINEKISKAVLKKVRKINKGLSLDQAVDEEGKVRIIEDYLKNNFRVIEAAAPVLSDIGQVLQNRYCNEQGIMKLFALFFKENQIHFQIVLTSDRMESKFDPEFEAFNYLQDYLVYFTKTDLYLSPMGTNLRLGFIPPENMHNHGLFIQPVLDDGFETGVGEIRFIPAIPHGQSKHDLYIHIDLAGSVDQPLITIENQSSGFYAQYVQPYYAMLPEQDQREIVKSLIDYICEEDEMTDISVQHTQSIDFGVFPFTVHASMATKKFTEKAGEDYLFKLGELIGPQVEIYKEKVRLLPVEHDFNRGYSREISFTVPTGYVIRNLDDLVINECFEIDGDCKMVFKSSYDQNNSIVKVAIEEYYKSIATPVDAYQDYRRIVNAAADFNKVVLVLEKQSTSH